MEKKVGINQRISINVMEMAMKAALDGCFTPEYAADLASGSNAVILKHPVSVATISKMIKALV